MTRAQMIAPRRRRRPANDWPTLFDTDQYLVTAETIEAARWPCTQCGCMPLRPDPPIPGLPYWGADPCLGWLPNVAHACCGHGTPADAYVVISPGCHPSQPCADLTKATTLWAEDAVEYFRSLRVGPPSQGRGEQSDAACGGSE